MKTLKTLIYWLLIVMVVVVLYHSIRRDRQDLPALAFSDFIGAIQLGVIEEATLSDGEIVGTFREGNEHYQGMFRTLYPKEYVDFIPELISMGAAVKVEARRDDPIFTIFVTWGPLLLIAGLWIFFMRRFQRGSRAGRLDWKHWQVMGLAARKLDISLEDWLRDHAAELARHQLETAATTPDFPPEEDRGA